jgi:hypothetical protein
MVRLVEIKNAVEALSPAELTELTAFVRRRGDAAWDQQVDADFGEGGRLASVINKARDDIRVGRLTDLP